MRNKMREWKQHGEEIDREINELLDRVADLTAANTALRQENMRLSGECHELHAKLRKAQVYPEPETGTFLGIPPGEGQEDAILKQLKKE